MRSQSDQLYQLLKERGEEGVTALEALKLVGTMRLAARMYDLRRDLTDETILTLRAVTPTGKIVARYVLRPKVKDLTLGL